MHNITNGAFMCENPIYLAYTCDTTTRWGMDVQNEERILGTKDD